MTANGPITTAYARMLLGDEAIAGEARWVICGAKSIGDIKRSLLGGMILDYDAGDSWTAFDGSVILVPRRELVIPSYHRGARIDQLVCNLAAMEPEEGQ